MFAAASMTETLTHIADLYAQVAPNVTLVYNFDSSGTLKTQIQEGAACDLFISAGRKQVNRLDINADPEVNTDGLDFVVAESRINLLENRVTLCVPEGNPKGILGVPGALSNVGLIRPLSACFCAECNRIRLTADGKLKPCLHSPAEFPIKGLDDDGMRAQFEDAILAKPAWHGELSRENHSRAGRSMNRIGG